MAGEKPDITHPTVTIEFSLSILLAFNFNEDELLCAFF
jgi:hypothetical protein